MRTTIRIPTQDQYAFVEIELEVEGVERTTAETIKNLYDEYTAPFKVGEGIDDKTFNSFIEQQLSGKGIENGMIEAYEKMNERQRYAVDVLRRGKARLKAKGEAPKL